MPSTITAPAVTCSVSGVGNGGTFTAAVELIDANRNPVTNTTGSNITVSQSTTGQGSSTPGNVTMAQNASSSATFTLTLSNGSNKTAAQLPVTATYYDTGASWSFSRRASRTNRRVVRCAEEPEFVWWPLSM